VTTGSPASATPASGANAELLEGWEDDGPADDDEDTGGSSDDDGAWDDEEGASDTAEVPALKLDAARDDDDGIAADEETAALDDERTPPLDAPPASATSPGGCSRGHAARVTVVNARASTRMGTSGRNATLPHAATGRWRGPHVCYTGVRNDEATDVSMEPSSPKAGRWPLVVLSLGAAALVCAAYANHFNNGFQFDDSHTIESNAAIRDISNIPRFFRDATTTSSLPQNQAYRPGVTTLHAIDVALGGQPEPQAAVFHRTIFITFLFLCAFVFLLFKRVFDISRPDDSNAYWALAGATFFGVHAANAETINYISARSDSASTTWVLLALVLRLYLPRARFLDVACMAVGFFIKEPSVMLVPLVGLYTWLFEEQRSLPQLLGPGSLAPLWRAVRGMLPFGVVAVGLIIFSRAMTPPTWAPGNPEPLRYIATQPFVILHYVFNFILPLNLCVDTDWVAVTSFTDDRVFAGLLFVAALVALAWNASRTASRRPVAFGLLWFLLTLMPTSLMPLGEVLNDHRPFFGYIGLVMAVTWAFALWVPRRELAVLVWVPLLCAHAYGVHERNHVWGDDLALWQDAVAKAPGQGRSHMNLAVGYMKRARWEEAETSLLRAVQLVPLYAYVHVNLGIVRGALNKQQEAEVSFNRALELGPGFPDVHAHHAEWLRSQGRHEEALQRLRVGLHLSPMHARMLATEKQLEFLAQRAARNREVAASLQAAPTWAGYMDLSLAYYNNQEYRHSMEAAAAALQLDPRNALALNNICAAFNKLQDWDSAVDACNRALTLDPTSQIARNNLILAQQRGNAAP
jgi:Tfp pilus assembly protein PilF